MLNVRLVLPHLAILAAYGAKKIEDQLEVCVRIAGRLNQRTETNYLAREIEIAEQYRHARTVCDMQEARLETLVELARAFWRQGEPVLLCYFDFSRKVVGFGPLIQPTGDTDADLKLILDFYRPVRGKYRKVWQDEAHI